MEETRVEAHGRGPAESVARAALAGDPGAWNEWRTFAHGSVTGLLARSDERFGLSGAAAQDALAAVLLRQYLREKCRFASVPGPLDDARVVSDVLLAAAFRLGTCEAVAAVRQRYQGLVRNVVYHSVGAEDASEAEAEIWGALWEKLRLFEGRSTLRTWLNVVVKRWCWDRKKRLQLPPGPEWTSEEGTSIADMLPADLPETSTSLACEEFGQALDACTISALRALVPQERALLRLRLIHQMPLEEVRHRPEIYAESEPVQPVYGITRRVQRTGRRVRELAFAALARRGYTSEDCVRMLEQCEGAGPDLAASLARDLRSDDENLPG